MTNVRVVFALHSRPVPRPDGSRVSDHRLAQHLIVLADAAGRGAGTSPGASDWTWHEITVMIAPDADLIGFGVFLNGRGKIELRDPQLAAHGE